MRAPRLRFRIGWMLAAVATAVLLLGSGHGARRLWRSEVYREAALFHADVERHFLVKSSEARSAGDLMKAQDYVDRAKEHGRLKTIYRRALSRPMEPLSLDEPVLNP